MRKLKLEDLAVESFATTKSATDGKGTVRGNQVRVTVHTWPAHISCNLSGCGTGGETWEGTCNNQNTCCGGGTCNEHTCYDTCQASCEANTCAVTCHCSNDDPACNGGNTTVNTGQYCLEDVE